MSACPGLYCGRIFYLENNYSACGACPRGFRVDDDGVCIECHDKPEFYDQLYITFMVFLLIVAQWYLTDQCFKRRQLTLDLIILYTLAAVESLLALCISLLLTDPIGSLEIRSCSIKRLADWYTLFFNPSPDFKTTIRCTQEAVFPLYTLIFKFYLFSFLLLLFRPVILHLISSSAKLVSAASVLQDISTDSNSVKNIYLTLYLIPSLIVIHALFCGLIYYSFPLLILIGSFISIALHLAFQLDQRPEKLFLSLLQRRNAVITICHWLIHSYGIVALTQLNYVYHLFLFVLVPLPTIFYIITSKFTDPNKLHFD